MLYNPANPCIMVSIVINNRKEIMRKMVNIEFANRMSKDNALVAMHQSASMGAPKWVNKDIRAAASTGDWSELLKKAERSTKYFRNTFYR